MNIDALPAVLVLFALVWLYLGPWQSVCTAYARQIVFEKRDRLFDMAREGEIRFNSVEYREIRVSLEELIRFAHDLTLFNFIFVSRQMSLHVARPVSALRRNVLNISDAETREKVEILVAEAHKAVLLMILAKSVASLPLVMLWAYSRNIKTHRMQNIRQMAKPYGEMVQLEAEAARVNKIAALAA